MRTWQLAHHDNPVCPSYRSVAYVLLAFFRGYFPGMCYRVPDGIRRLNFQEKLILIKWMWVSQPTPGTFNFVNLTVTRIDCDEILRDVLSIGCGDDAVGGHRLPGKRVRSSLRAGLRFVDFGGQPLGGPAAVGPRMVS